MTTPRSIDPAAIEAAAKAINRVLCKRPPARDAERHWAENNGTQDYRKEEAAAAIVAYLDWLRDNK